MIDKDFEIQMESIEKILQLVSKYGIEFEIQESANFYIEQNPELHIAQAYRDEAVDWDCL